MTIATTQLALEASRHGGRHGAFFILPLLLLLAGTVFFLFMRRRRAFAMPGGPARTSALSVLQERFARGEIDRDEYDHRKAVLRDDDTVPPAPPKSSRPISETPPESTTEDDDHSES